MIVVCNASPIIALACAGQLNLLRGVYSQIIVPNAVFEEITVAGKGEPGASEVAAAAWITRQTVSNGPLVSALCLELDAGEAETIALAIELKADLVLLDERIGRCSAPWVDCRWYAGHFDCGEGSRLTRAVRPVLDALRVDAGFWIADELYCTVLKAASE